jgi:UPF0716 protein FxsA
MLLRLFLLFTLIPLIELYLLVRLSDVIGLGTTIVIVVLSGVVGASLAKAEGLRMIAKWQRDLAEGRMPEDAVVEGLLLLVGGVLLITPGVLTDLTGLLLLVRPVRRRIVLAIKGAIERRMRDGRIRVVHFGDGFAAPRSGDVIDVEGEDVTNRDPGDSSRELR